MQGSKVKGCVSMALFCDLIGWFRFYGQVEVSSCDFQLSLKTYDELTLTISNEFIHVYSDYYDPCCAMQGGHVVFFKVVFLLLTISHTETSPVHMEHGIVVAAHV